MAEQMEQMPQELQRKLPAFEASRQLFRHCLGSTATWSSEPQPLMIRSTTDLKVVDVMLLQMPDAVSTR